MTGASSGIGAIAKALAAAGAKVVVNYAGGADRAHAMVEKIRAAGGEAMAIRADVSREDEVEAMFAEMIETWGSIDILGQQRRPPERCTAGRDEFGQLATGSRHQFDRPIFVLPPPFANSSVAAWCGTVARRRQDHLYFVGARHHPVGGARQLRHFQGRVSMMMKTMAQELAPQRIRVNAISPGAIKDPINTAAWMTPEPKAELLKLIPARRVGEPDDIARATVWLASDDSDYVTGATLYVDGSMTSIRVSIGEADMKRIVSRHTIPLRMVLLGL